MRPILPLLLLTALSVLPAAEGVPAPAGDVAPVAPAAPAPPTEAEIAAAGTITGAVLHIQGRGDLHLELFGTDAPRHVATFAKLARSGFYDGVAFHRVEPGFVIQAGNPNTKVGHAGRHPLDGPGYDVKLEVNRHQHDVGALGMARRREPDSAGSQFYITLGPAHFLDAGYTVFGKVVGPEDLEVARSVVPGDRFTVEVFGGK